MQKHVDEKVKCMDQLELNLIARLRRQNAAISIFS